MTVHDLELSPWVVRVFAFLFGLAWGSFLNVVIYRLPRDMSVVRPPSHCPACGAPVRAYDNLPVVSFVLLGGRARCCKARLSPRYPAVELVGGVLSVAILETLARQLSAETSILRAGAMYVSELALALGLVAAAFIDAEHMYLPDPITIGGTVLGLGTASLRDLSYLDSALGAVAGFVGVYVPFALLYKVVRGKPGLGLGDAKLVMLAGAWFGWQGALFVFMAGAVQGTVGALLIYLVRGRIDEPEAVKADREELLRAAAEGDEEAKKILDEDPLGAPPEGGLMQARLSFGPFLILGVLEYLLLGEWIRSQLALAF